jgi:hypothetical protein
VDRGSLPAAPSARPVAAIAASTPLVGTPPAAASGSSSRALAAIVGTYVLAVGPAAGIVAAILVATSP